MKQAHIAGEAVSLDGVSVQRCACCGKLLRQIAYGPDRNPGDLVINYMKGTVVVLNDQESDALKRIETYAVVSDFIGSNEINTPTYPPIEDANYCWQGEAFDGCES